MHTDPSKSGRRGQFCLNTTDRMKGVRDERVLVTQENALPKQNSMKKGLTNCLPSEQDNLEGIGLAQEKRTAS